MMACRGGVFGRGVAGVPRRAGFGAGVPGQESFEVWALGGLAAVAAAFVEVGGDPGQEVRAGHLHGGGDGPDDGGEPGGVPVTGSAGVFW